MKKELHIYHIAETEWWVGETLESILEAFRKTVGEPEASTLLADSDEASPLDDSCWDKMIIMDIDEPGHPQYSFRQAVEDAQKSGQIPCCIASSEY